jgi:hypothetical protein
MIMCVLIITFLPHQHCFAVIYWIIWWGRIKHSISAATFLITIHLHIMALFDKLESGLNWINQNLSNGTLNKLESGLNWINQNLSNGTLNKLESGLNWINQNLSNRTLNKLESKATSKLFLDIYKEHGFRLNSKYC